MPLPAKTVTCPHCGLVLALKQGKGATRLTYDIPEWKGRCLYLGLGSPMLCLLEPPRKGTKSPD